MLLRGGIYSACHAAAVEDNHLRSCRFPRPPFGKPAAVSCSRPRRTHMMWIDSVYAGESKSKPQELRLNSLSKDGSSYKEKFIVRSYEVGINKSATVETIANFLQEVSCNHIQSFGFMSDGFPTSPTMRKLHLIWVMTRMHIEMYDYPAWSDVVEIETFGHMDRTGNFRDWILKDHATGEVIGRATSKWVMINQDTRRIQKISDETRNDFLRYATQRQAFPEENYASLRKIAKLDDPAQHSRIGLVPRRADLDMNQHINNVTYIVWALESMLPEIIGSHELQAITLEFRRECQQHDTVDSHTSCDFNVGGTVAGIQGNTTNLSSSTAKGENGCLHFLHLLRLSKNGSEISRGCSVWRKKLARE